MDLLSEFCKKVVELRTIVFSNVNLVEDWEAS